MTSITFDTETGQRAGVRRARGSDRSPPRVWVGRVELVLARRDWFPLREVPLEPDPLEGLARALATADPERGESLEVVIDLLPLTDGERRRRRRDAVADVDRDRGAGPLAEVLFGPAGVPAGLQDLFGRPGRTPAAGKPAGEGWLAREERLKEARGIRDKVLGWDAAFWLQVLIRAETTVKKDRGGLLQAAESAFEVFAGENYFRVRGRKLWPFFLGSDSWLHRRDFDRRWNSGLHTGPRRAPMVTVGEIAGLLKPPTMHCAVDNVARSGGVIPRAPRGLPTYHPNRSDLLPLGWITTGSGERPVAVRLADTTFGYTCGRTGAGKTYSAVARATAVFNGGHGGMFLDPHRDGVELLKQYLHDRSDDVWEIDLCDEHQQRQAGWNLFSMAGCSSADIEAKVSAVVTGFAAALRWGESIAPRALMLTTMAAQALCELALRLPPHLAPTIFQMLPLLGDDQWRTAVLPHTSPHVQAFFAQRFPKLDPRAITPVTNIVDRMRSSRSVAALLGSPRSTYDIRAAMDQGRVVLWSTGTDAWANLVACLITQDLFRAAMSRRRLPPERRRPFWVWIDEAQRISGTGSGSVGEAVARSLEEARKMGLRLQLMSQQPARLARPTWDAITTNRSMLASHEVGADSADTLAKEWGRDIKPETITRLRRHTFLTQVTLDGNVTRPFLVRGFDIATERPWVDWRNATDPHELERANDTNLRRRPVTEILAELDTLDTRILDHFGASNTPLGHQQDRPPDPPTSADSGNEHGPAGHGRASGHNTPICRQHRPPDDEAT